MGMQLKAFESTGQDGGIDRNNQKNDKNQTKKQQQQ